MAKRKVKSKSKSKSVRALSRNMAKTKRRGSSARRSAPAKRRRRRSGLSAGGGMMANLRTNLQGAAGGVAYTGLSMVVKKPMMRLLVGTAGSMALAMMVNPYIGAGMMGATANDAVKPLLAKVGLADDLEDMDYIPADSLSDTGYVDDNGESVMSDSDGIIYELQDGTYTAVGDSYDLQDNYEMSDVYALSDDMQSVSMLPL